MNPRIAIGALTLSAAAFVGLATHEGYTDRAVIPTKGDVPTVGFGSTVREDGTRVTMADATTPVAALRRSMAHLSKDEARLKRCVTAPLNQVEYDTLVDFSYQYGVHTTCASTMVALVNVGKYAQACEAYTRYRFSAGFDCSTPGNKVCAGVWDRSQKRRAACAGAVGPPSLGVIG